MQLLLEVWLAPLGLDMEILLALLVIATEVLLALLNMAREVSLAPVGTVTEELKAVMEEDMVSEEDSVLEMELVALVLEELQVDKF